MVTSLGDDSQRSTFFFYNIDLGFIYAIQKKKNYKKKEKILSSVVLVIFFFLNLFFGASLQ